MTFFSAVVFCLTVAVVASPSPAPRDIDQLPCDSRYYEQFGQIVVYFMGEKKFTEARLGATRVLKYMHRCDSVVGDAYRARIFEAAVYFNLGLTFAYVKQFDEADANISRATEIAREEMRRTDLSKDDRAAVSRMYDSFTRFQKEIEEKRQPP